MQLLFHIRSKQLRADCSLRRSAYTDKARYHVFFGGSHRFPCFLLFITERYTQVAAVSIRSCIYYTIKVSVM